MDFNNLERKTKAELFELIQSKQAEIDELQNRIDAATIYSKVWYKSSGSALALKIIEILKVEQND